MVKPRATTDVGAIVFDVGETLLHYAGVGLNWSEHYGDALTHVATACGLDHSNERLVAGAAVLSRYNTRTHPRLVEVAADVIFHDILGRWTAAPEPLVPKAIAAFFSYFQRRAVTYEDARPALQWLRDRGYPIGVLTDVPYGMPAEFVRQDLQRAGIDDLVDVVVTSVDVGYRKPHPAGFRAVAAALGVTAGRLLYVGNERKDMEGALAVDAAAVLVDRDDRRLDFGQRFTIASLRALPELVGFG